VAVRFKLDRLGCFLDVQSGMRSAGLRCELAAAVDYRPTWSARMIQRRSAA